MLAIKKKPLDLKDEVPPTSPDSFRRGLAKALAIGLLIALAGVLVAAIAVPRIIDAVPLTVLTGSMRPTLEPGTMIISQKVDADDVRTGDIITYQLEAGKPELVTHRVKEIAYDAYGIHHFTLRGDANGLDDPPVLPDQIKGRFLYQLPYLGFAAGALPGEAKPVILQVVGGTLIVWSLFQIISSRRSRRPRADDTRSDDATASRPDDDSSTAQQPHTYDA
jgi:signal peptidase